MTPEYRALKATADRLSPVNNFDKAAMDAIAEVMANEIEVAKYESTMAERMRYNALVRQHHIEYYARTLIETI